MSKKWMPINTAEKVNGSKILCYGDGYIFEAECETDDGFSLWCSIGGSEATHWMPLPSPPCNTMTKGNENLKGAEKCK